MKARMPEEYKKAKVNSNVQLTMYDINKQLINQMEPLTEDERAGHFYTTLLPFLDETNNSYYMLLCRDINYYTLFHRTGGAEDESFDKVLEEILDNYGTWITYSWANEQTKDAIEYWVKITMPGGDEDKFEDLYCFLLFPYDAGLVEVS